MLEFAGNPNETTAANQSTVEVQSNQVTFVNETQELEEKPHIMVLGVGGGGSNAVNNMYKKGINDVDFYVCNTDWQALKSSPVPGKLSIGQHGAGGHPEKGAKHAREHAEAIKTLCQKSRMLFIAACMGGGTGTGAAPVIAELAKQIKIDDDDDINDILVVAVVTTPFKFEGPKKLASARAGIEGLRKYADSVIVINNDKLPSLGNKVPINEVFAMADNVLYTAVNGIAQVITRSDYINVDFHDVYSIMSGSKTALMGCGVGKGEGRVVQALEAASSSVLLDDQDIRNAKGCLACITYSSEHPITMEEFTRFTDYIQNNIIDSENADANVIWGTGVDETLGEEVQITLVATGYENTSLDMIAPARPTKNDEQQKKDKQEKKVIPFDESESTKETTAPVPPVDKVVEPVAEDPDGGMTLVDLSAKEEQTPSHTEQKNDITTTVNVDSGDVSFDFNKPQSIVEQESHKDETPAQPADDEMKIISKPAEKEQEPVAGSNPISSEPVGGGKPTPDKPMMAESAFRQRIQRMKELLKSSKGIEEASKGLSDSTIASTVISAASEVSSMSINAQGDINSTYLFGNPD